MGHLHPVTQIIDQIVKFFQKYGFVILDGPELETIKNNFDILNTPTFHPSRDPLDTFYTKSASLEKKVLRTHTTPVTMGVAPKLLKPPYRVIAFGKTYRRDYDISHTPMFHQLDGIIVEKDIRFSDLKGLLSEFALDLFGKDTGLRFYPHYFPFTEPSAEMEISCSLCQGKGCRTCGGSGWLELLGCGMTHKNVLKMTGIDSSKWQSLAWGMGVERPIMVKTGQDDIRLFYENDLRFLEQY